MNHPQYRRFSRLYGAWLLAVLVLVVMLACGGTAPAATSPEEAGQASTVAPVGASAAPSDEAAPAAGDFMHSLSYAGAQREYLLHVPPAYDAGRPTPLVLAFHGISLDAEEMVRISGLSDEADAEGFIVAYPNGTGTSKSWNGGHCCGEAAMRNVDDVGFVDALITDVAALLSIDPRRVYATGFSNGAIFVYRLACELSDQIAAIGPVSATQILEDEEACRPARGVPVIHFHGTADRLNPYDGGATAAGYQWVSVQHAMQQWAQMNGCPPEPEQTTSGSIVHDVYGPCAQNASVELYTVTDGEHAWPGGESVSAQIGAPTMEIDATSLMWAFFSAYPKP